MYVLHDSLKLSRPGNNIGNQTSIFRFLPFLVISLSLTFGFPWSKEFSPLIAVSLFVGKQATMAFWMHPSVDKLAIAWVFVNPYTLLHPRCRATIFWHHCSEDEMECPLRFRICTCTHVTTYGRGTHASWSSTNTNLCAQSQQHNCVHETTSACNIGSFEGA